MMYNDDLSKIKVRLQYTVIFLYISILLSCSINYYKFLFKKSFLNIPMLHILCIDRSVGTFLMSSDRLFHMGRGQNKDHRFPGHC